jgi:glutamate-1-semialdehyde 2,1-aminomutase
MEPMNATYPIPGFLEGVRELADKIGAILIFDETITGFRFAKGGAQELFGVIPDLSTFGKGIANGFPLSAVAGKKEIMMEMEEIFFSGTFGGELLSLAAAKKVLELHRTDNVTEQLNYIGTDLASRIERVISDANLTNIISLSGHPTWKFINWKSTDALSSNSLRTYFWQNMFQRGILLLGTHNVSLAHTSNIRKRIVDTYQESLGELANGIRSGDLLEKLRATPPEELFKIR